LNQNEIIWVIFHEENANPFLNHASLLFY